MALSPVRKTRKSPRLGIAKESGSKGLARSNSVAKASPKSPAVNGDLFHNDFSTPITAKIKLSLPKKELNEPLKYASDQEKVLAKSENAAGTSGKVAKSNLSAKKSSKINSTSSSKASYHCTNSHQVTSQSKDNRCMRKAKSARKNVDEVMASPKQCRKGDREVKDRVLGFDRNVDLKENHDLLLSNQRAAKMPSPQDVSTRKSSGLDGVVKRRKCPGVRVLGGRIYDSENGKTCHQCRQKTMEFVAPCKNVVGTKACTSQFCTKCLLNRYGEKVEEVVKMEDWKCPRCRGSCNCSICMKKQGRVPTGILVHAAKATGFASVADYLKCDVPSLKMVGALNDSALNAPLESIHSGNLDVKDLAKKLKRVKSSMISKEANESCPSKEHGSTPPVPSSKSCKLKSSLDKSSATCEVCESESEVASEMEKKTSKSKSFRGSNSKEVSVRKSSLVLHDDAKGAKGNSKMKSKIKVKKDAPDEGLYKGRKLEDDIGTSGEKKSDGTLFSYIAKSGNGNIEGNTLIKGEEVKDFQVVHADAEAVQRQQPTEKRHNLNQIHAFEACSNKENVMSVESGQISKVIKTPKKRKSDSIKVSEYKNAIENSEEKVAIFPDGNTEVTQKHVRRKNKKHKSIPEAEEEMVLPQGEHLKIVAGIEFSADDVGAALEFLEFCSAFEQVLDLKKGQPESVLRELMRGRIGRRGLYSSAVQFHVKLLSLIENDSGEQCSISLSGSGENSWLQVLKKHVMNEDSLLSSSDGQHNLRVEVPQVDSLTVVGLKGGVEGYDKLDSSRKLRLLNVLCNESLGTRCLRTWIESANTRFNESKKEHQVEVMAAKEKEREAKQKMKDEVARILLLTNDGAPLSIGEHQQLLLRVKLETEKAHAAKVDALEAASRVKKQRHDAVRTEPIAWDINGRVYWRLKGGSNRSVVILQDISNWEPLVGQDLWSVYNEEEEKVLTRRISRFQRASKRRQSQGSPEICNGELEPPFVGENEIFVPKTNSNAGVLDSGETDGV